MPTAKVIQERIFFPYTPFISSASYFCKELVRKDYVSWHDLLAATTLLALSVEAITNTIGELVVPNFTDFESSSPKAKIRIICERTGIDFTRNEYPFVEIFQLLKIRNKLAHPKFQPLRYESETMAIEQARDHYNKLGELLSDIETALTPDLAQRWLKAVLELTNLLSSAVDPKLYESSSKRLLIDDC